jgi:hypothetical protein
MPWLKTWAEKGLSAEAALDAFDGLPVITPEEMIGSWRGSELPTAHPLDGLLALYGWRGKRFEDAERVHPLLFEHHGRTVAVDPARLPLGVALNLPHLSRTDKAVELFRASLPLWRTRKPKARLRAVEHRGLVSAAMIYDDLPIIDHFRRADEGRVLGLMDFRRTPRPFFFLLEREG